MPRIFTAALAILSLLAMPCAIHAQDPQAGPAPLR